MNELVGQVWEFGDLDLGAEGTLYLVLGPRGDGGMRVLDLETGEERYRTKGILDSRFWRRLA